MSVYLHDIPLAQAKAALQTALESAGLAGLLGSETIALDENCVGRVLAEPVWAKISAPHYHASAMDGFAVRSESTNEALLTRPVTLTYGSQAEYVDTGDPLPDWANGVIQIENVEALDVDGNLATDKRNPASIRIREAIAPWKHVRAMGEDMVATQLVLPAGHTLRPIDLGAIAGSGHYEIKVSKRPRVAVLPTGTELKPIGEPVERGDIIEYNSVVLAGQINSWGGTATRYPITVDVFEAIKATVAEAVKEHDLVLLNAGSSAGSEDYSADVVQQLGTLLVHGVAVRPGHPVILGMLDADERQVPIVGVPGYPVSAALTGEIFVKPMLDQWLGRFPESQETIEATLTRKTMSPGGDDDYVRVVVGEVGDKTLAAPIARGAGVVSSLVRADGIVVFPSGTQGAEAGANVNVRLYRTREQIANTIFCIGSHDMTLDLLAQFLAQRGVRFVSSHVGSLGGLISLRRGEAHIAGSHLLDPETGIYNESYVQRYLPDTPVQIVPFVEREQGLIVPKGNPKGITSLADLQRDDLHFSNRQRGAGTRVLLDYHLDKLGIEADNISGYEDEEYTHLSVAAAVASGRADCGLGITAAATALELEFIPLFSERYEFIVPDAHTDKVAPLLELITNNNFNDQVNALGGYVRI